MGLSQTRMNDYEAVNAGPDHLGLDHPVLEGLGAEYGAVLSIDASGTRIGFVIPDVVRPRFLAPLAGPGFYHARKSDPDRGGPDRKGMTSTLARVRWRRASTVVP